MEQKTELFNKVIDRYQQFTRWVVRHTPEIEQSERGLNLLNEIDWAEHKVREFEEIQPIPEPKRLSNEMIKMKGMESEGLRYDPSVHYNNDFMEGMKAARDHYESSPDVTSDHSEDNLDMIPDVRDEIVYEALYNPMIHESAWGTLSLHRTRKGAETSIAFHRHEREKEWGHDPSEDWRVHEVKVQD